MSTLPQIRLEFETAEALQADFQANLRKGRAFVAGASGVSERELCELVLVHPGSGETFSVTADAVWVKRDEPGAGVGVQFHDFGAETAAKLKAFVEVLVAVGEEAADQMPTDDEADGGAADESDRSGDRRPRNVHERVCKMGSRERDAVARQGTLPERVALERHFGGAVWEGLLQNPNLTPPEVIRIARNGNLPKPLVGIIVSNAAWVSKLEVQRALLANPRVSGTHLDRVLRAMSQADLSRASQQSNYRMQVRHAAKKLLRK